MLRDELLVQHHDLTTALSGVYATLGQLLPEERRIKTVTFLQAQGSDKVRSNAADQASLHVTEQVLEQQKRVDSLTCEIENVRLQLHYS